MGKETFNEWFPSLEEHNPNITKEQWIELIQDKTIFIENALITFACIQEAKIATCADMTEEFGRSINFYNGNNWQTGKRIWKRINCPLSQREKGDDRFWSVCCLARKLKNGRYEFKIRPELQQAFEETGVLEKIEVIEKNSFFTWISFYQEMAEKLLTFKEDREELLKIVYGMDRQFVDYIKDENGNDYPDIDPFSVFAIFNRTSTNERRIEICKYFRNALQIKSDIPRDFDSIPIMNAQLSVFVGRDDIYTGIQPVWDLYSSIFENNFNDDLFSEKFDIVRNQKGIKWTLTMALYWIRPCEFMSLDSNSRAYLQKIGINVFDEKKLNGKNYLKLVREIKSKIVNKEIKEKSFLEISYNAWKKETGSSGDAQMTSVQEKLVEKYTTLLQNTKNLVLTGAPGTGKTYLAKQIAKAMGCTENEIGFVQFHQSYDYTDFVEGLRPVQDANGNGNQIGFERKDGVFKEFCRKALFSQTLKGTNLFDGVNDNPVIWKVSLDGTGENPTRTDCMENGCIRIGWKGYGDIEDFSDYENFDKGGKFILRNFQKEMKIGDIVVSCYSATETDAIGIVTGDYEYKEENDKILPRYRKVKWLVKNIRENIVEINGGKTFTLSTIYKTSISLQSIKNIVLKYDKERTSETTHQAKKNFVFIIDEINRGEVSKIFGELFYCIDPGYRGEKGRISTQYQNLVTSGEFQKGFFIPENVYIIGTMNDIDRSVESMDFAFRRRFAWAEIKAEETQYMLDKFVDENGETHGLSEELAKEAKEKMNRLNKAISDEQELGSAYHIGASYFLKLKNYEGDFGKLWNYHIKGILQEYLRGSGNEAKIAELKAAYDKKEEMNNGE